MHSLVDVSGLTARNLIKNQAVRRVKDIEGLPCQGGHGLIGNEIELHRGIVNVWRILKITHGTRPGCSKRALKQSSGRVKVESMQIGIKSMPMKKARLSGP